MLHRFDEKKQIQVSVATPYLSLFISGPPIYTEPTSTKPLHIHHVAPHRSYRADLKTQRKIIPLPSACSRPGPNTGLNQTCALCSYLVTMTWGKQFGASFGNPSSLICRKPTKFSKMIPEVKELPNNIKHVFLKLLCCLVQQLILSSQESQKYFLELGIIVYAFYFILAPRNWRQTDLCDWRRTHSIS